jgi:hypothetical protein
MYIMPFSAAQTMVASCKLSPAIFSRKMSGRERTGKRCGLLGRDGSERVEIRLISN